MRFRLNNNDDPQGGDGPSPGGAGGRDLEGMRRRARHLAASGDDAVEMALSRNDSTAFLASSQQEGGQ